MDMKGMSLGFYRLCEWIMRLAYVNLLWGLFIVAGGVILGIGPSTAAMFAVIRKWIMGEEVPIFKTFWSSYKTEFKKANALALLLVIIGYILFLDIRLLGAQEGLSFSVLRYVMVPIILVYGVMLMYIFPIFVHYELKFFHYFRSAILFGIMHPIQTILMGISCVGIYYVLIYVPGLIPFFAGSIFSFSLMWFANRTFSKVELAVKNTEKVADKNEMVHL